MLQVVYRYYQTNIDHPPNSLSQFFIFFSLKRIYLMLYPLVLPIYHSFATVGDGQSGSVDINLRLQKNVVDQQ